MPKVLAFKAKGLRRRMEAFGRHTNFMGECLFVRWELNSLHFVRICDNWQCQSALLLVAGAVALGWDGMSVG